MSNYEVAELRWENGQVGMHGLSGLFQTKSTWGASSSETLESIVHQATGQSSGDKWAEASTPGRRTSVGVDSLMVKKRSRLDSSSNSSNSRDEGGISGSGSGSGSATFCRESENNTTMDITGASFASPPSFKPKATSGDSDNSHGGSEINQDKDRDTKSETARSHSSRRTRAAAVHNLSERRRRDRINQKMKALQKLVPNASKIDKASMLDEVIEYLKQLQAQIQMMSNVRNNMPQMMMSLGMQHHQQHQLQMSLLASMGMGVGLGMGMGMLDTNSIPHTNPQSLPPLLHPTPVTATATATATSTPTFVPPPFLVPSMISPHASEASNQSMNMEQYNKMAAFYQQQLNQTAQAMSYLSHQNHSQADY